MGADKGGPRLAEEAKDGEYPLAVVIGEKVFEFGELEPHSQMIHRFTVRNEGKTEFAIGHGGSTCKCTMANIKTRFLSRVKKPRLRSCSTRGREREYLQTAKIITNDPLHREPFVSSAG